MRTIPRGECRRAWPFVQVLALFAMCATGCSTSRWARDQADFDPQGRRLARKGNTSQPTYPLDAPGSLPAESSRFCEWANENLQSGDILFSMSDARAFFGLFPFARVLIQMTDSRFSHTGLLSREDGELVVYDMAPGGPRRMSLEEYMRRNGTHAFAVKRVRPEHRDAVPAAVAYCQKAYERRCPFDRVFSCDDECLYCTEMTQKAYADGGIQLSRPVRLDRFPRYRDYPKLTRLGHALTKIKPDQRIIIPGNDSMGLWASPELELVYDNGRPGFEPRGEARVADRTHADAKARPYRIVSVSDRTHAR